MFFFHIRCQINNVQFLQIINEQRDVIQSDELFVREKRHDAINETWINKRMKWIAFWIDENVDIDKQQMFYVDSKFSFLSRTNSKERRRNSNASHSWER